MLFKCGSRTTRTPSLSFLFPFLYRPPSFYLFVKEMFCYERIKLLYSIQKENFSSLPCSLDCHLKIRARSNDAEILVCGKIKKLGSEEKAIKRISRLRILKVIQKDFIMFTTKCTTCSDACLLWHMQAKAGKYH